MLRWGRASDLHVFRDGSSGETVMVRRIDTEEDDGRISQPLLPDSRYPRPRRRGLRVLGGIGKGIGWVIFSVLALVASAWLHVFTPLARDVLRDVALEQVNRSIEGRIAVGHIGELDYGHARISELAIYDPQGRRVVYLDEVTVEPDMAAILFEGTIHFDSVSARDGYVELIETPEGPPSLVAAFQSTTPKPETDQPGPSVEIDEIRVRNVRVSATYDPVDDLTLGDLRVEGAMRFEDDVFEASIDSATFRVVRGGRTVAALESLRATFDGAEGEAEVHARIRAGDDGQVWVDATADLPEPGVGVEGAGGPRGSDSGQLQHVEADVRVSKIGPEDLRALGLDPLQLRSEVSGRITFDGSPETFVATADVSTDGGDLEAQVRMHADDRVEARVSTDGLDVAAVWGEPPVPYVAGTVIAEVSGVSTPDDMDVEVRVSSLRAGEWRVPSATARAHIGDERVRIESLRLPYLDGDVEVRGTVGFDGSADVHLSARVPSLRAEPNLRRMLPGVRGALDAEVDFEMRPTGESTPPRIAVRGEAEVRDATLGPLSAERLRVAGNAHGNPSAPVVDVSVEGRAIDVGDQLSLRSADVEIRGGPREYDVDGRVVGPAGERGAVQAQIARAGRGFVIDAQGVGQNVVGRDWGFTAQDVHVKPSGAIEIGSVDLRSGETAIHISGTYHAGGRSNLETTIDHVDAQLIADLLGLERLEGDLEGRLSFSGSVKRPEIDAMLWYTGGTVRGVYVDDAALVLDLSTDAGVLTGQLEMDLGTHGALAAVVDARFDAGRREPFLDALREGRFDAKIESRDLSLALIGEVMPDAPDIAGRIDGDVVVTGTARDPEVSVALRGIDLSYQRGVPIDLVLEGGYADEDLRLALVAEDERGRLADAELRAEIDVPAIIREPSRAAGALDTQPWELSVRTAPRRLDELPRPLRVDVPARAVLSAHATHTPGEPLEADVDVGVTWVGDVVSCAASGTPRALARVRLAGGRADVEVIGRLGARQVLGANASFAAPIDAMLRTGGPPTLPVIDGQIRLEEMALGEIPVVCEGAMGSLSGEVTIEGLFGESPTIVAALHGNDIRYGDAPPGDLGVQAQIDRGEGVVMLEMADASGGGIEADLRVPLAWEGPLPALGDAGTFRAHVAMERFHIEPLSAIPALSFAEGTLDGNVDVTGTVRAPVFDGFVELNDVAFGLVQPAQRFEDGTGRIVFHRNWIELDRIHFHDLGGTLRASGSIGLDGLVPRRARIALYADDLPIRSEGMPIGELTAQASIRADIQSRKAEVWIRTRNMTIEVERKLRTNIQDLDPHPDVVLVRNGEPIGREEDDQPEIVPMDVVVHVDARDPFWVRRDDFAVRLLARLDVRTNGPGDVRVAGYVDFQRGWLELLGKRFELEEGRVDFIGGSELNPRIDLMMSHELDARPGEQVFVRVIGHLQQPELEFSSTIPGVSTPGEVLALLAGAGSGAGGEGASESTAARQATSFLAGVTAGVLTLTARRELGDVFPDISLEATDRGARLRAGFDAERLIPGFLEGIVKGAYIEGYVLAESSGGAQQTSTQGQSVGGVAIELVFPHSIVGTAEVQPPESWSLDVMYEP